MTKREARKVAKVIAADWIKVNLENGCAIAAIDLRFPDNSLADNMKVVGLVESELAALAARLEK
jgi:hypothetical protein